MYNCFWRVACGTYDVMPWSRDTHMPYGLVLKETLGWNVLHCLPCKTDKNAWCVERFVSGYTSQKEMCAFRWLFAYALCAWYLIMPGKPCTEVCLKCNFRSDLSVFLSLLWNKQKFSLFPNCLHNLDQLCCMYFPPLFGVRKAEKNQSSF